MDACRKIYFHTPAQIAATWAGIAGLWAALLALCILCI